jgi:divalent metal cation (Fe/Co/Zn/Cd) transporter
MSITGADHRRAEDRALQLGTAGNVVGGITALVFYLHSGSDALLLDGLYTAVMAGAAVIAGRVNRAALQPRSRAYPFGASGHESLYVLFRTLVLLGIIAYAVTSAVAKVISHLQGKPIQTVELSGLGWYFAAMVLLNLWLWRVFRMSWRQGECSSEMLRGMAISARLDALISVATGVGLLGAPLLLGTILAPLVPIADSLLVLVLCLSLMHEPLNILIAAVHEAAGSSKSVSEESVSQCKATTAPMFLAQGCELIELAILKLGRTYTVVAYVEPRTPVSGEAVDALRARLEQTMQTTLQAQVLAEVIPTASHPYTGSQS